jgi:hypothetical protein
MSQAHVAYLLGTKQSNLSAYESGTLEPGEVVSRRIAAFLELTIDTAHQGTWLGTMASHAVALRGIVASSRLPRIDLDLIVMRYVIGMHDSFSMTPHLEDQQFYFAEPSSTGDRGVDALLAGMCVHMCRSTSSERAPRWTRAAQRFLDTPWWIGIGEDTPILKARALVDGLPSLRARGVYLDRATLASA